jgi:hypothetical protein
LVAQPCLGETSINVPTFFTLLYTQVKAPAKFPTMKFSNNNAERITLITRTKIHDKFRPPMISLNFLLRKPKNLIDPKKPSHKNPPNWLLCLENATQNNMYYNTMPINSIHSWSQSCPYFVTYLVTHSRIYWSKLWSYPANYKLTPKTYVNLTNLYLAAMATNHYLHTYDKLGSAQTPNLKLPRTKLLDTNEFKF